MKMQDAEPLIQKVSPLPLPPFLLNDGFYDALAENLPPKEQTVQPLRMSQLYFLPGIFAEEMQQLRGRLQRSEKMGKHYHRQLHIEVTKLNTPRTRWALSLELWHAERTL